MNIRFNPKARPTSAANWLWISLALAVLSVLLCGIPFVQPPLPLVWMAIVASLLTMMRGVFAGGSTTLRRLLAAFAIMSFDSFAMFLTFHGLHLIDWMEKQY